METAKVCPRLTMPFEPEICLDDRKVKLAEGMKHLATAARARAIAGGSIENGVIKIDRLMAAIPADADGLVHDFYGSLPSVRITDLLQEADGDIGFTEAFTRRRTGAPCKNRIELFNVLLAEGSNLGLKKVRGDQIT